MTHMKILVIDDEKEICEMITKALTRNGYEVTTANSIHTAGKLITSAQWDLIITDVMIPYVGGFELVDDIKANSSTPVIVMSGMSEDVLAATVNKADLLIHKPFSGNELVQAVKDLIGEKAI